MMWIWLISTFVLGYLLLWWLVPKGYLFHELVRIPWHLWRLKRLPKVPMQVEKIAYGTHFRQYFLLCIPEQGVQQQEVIFYLHGGAWMFGRPELFYANAGYFIQRGYAVVMPSYRRPPFYPYPKMRQDLRTAIQLAATKKFPAQSWIIAGMSAGANLATLLLLDQEEQDQRLSLNQIVSGLLLFGAPLDLRAMPSSIPLHSFAGWRRSSASFQRASPIHHLPAPHPIPLLAIHGTRDGLVPYPAAQSFLTKWPSSFLKTYLIPGGTHLDCSGYLTGDKKMQKLIDEWLESVINTTKN